VGEEQAPTSAPGTAPNTVKIGEAVASELSRLLSVYLQQVQETFQAHLSQVSEHWQSALKVHAGQYTKQWQEAVQAMAAQRTQGAPGLDGPVRELDAQLAASAKPLIDLSDALLGTLNTAVEQIAQDLKKATRPQQDSTATGDSGEAD
jgi:hypothetical protein